jgi:CRISPR-associated protein Csm1
MIIHNNESKIVILAGLFHDIGKFSKICLGSKETHQDIGCKYLDSFRGDFLKIFNINEDDFEKLKSLLKNHHTKTDDHLTNVISLGNSLSSGRKVDVENNNEHESEFSNTFLSSVFSQIQLRNEQTTSSKYYKHKPQIKENYSALIPASEAELVANKENSKYNVAVWEKFNNDLAAILHSFNNDEDFDTLINLILVVFEKYLWCLPDYKGNNETDISLFNHLKDTAGFAHAIFLSQKDNKINTKLNLIIGDIPGIQNYIFDVMNTKAAKMLRGRSIFIQILTRIFSSKFLEEFGLTECSLIMLAGGKFYIVAPSLEDFNHKFDIVKKKIDKYLIDTFNYDMKFCCAYEPFCYNELINNTIEFGEIIEKANISLTNAKNNLFENNLFDENNYNFIIREDFIKSEGDSNKVKCFLTDKPIFKNNYHRFTDDDGIVHNVDKQAHNEFIVGNKVVKNNTIIDYKDFSIIPEQIKEFKDYDGGKITQKILINPDIADLLKSDMEEKYELLRNVRFLEVANFVSENQHGNTMDFEEMSDNNIGAKYLCLIKGDIDNLGLIMAYGLDRDKNDFKGVSRITTMSYSLKYFYSNFLNGLLYDLESKKRITAEQDNKIYTIFAGGDDLMLITTQSYSLELLKTINDKFKEFVCGNKEIHISYSITHFRHSTPIKIISEFSEDNQKTAKKDNLAFSDIRSLITGSNDFFTEERNKSKLFIFDTVMSINDIDILIETSNNLIKWASLKEEKQKLSSGIIVNLMTLSMMMKDFVEKGETKNLMYHPLLSYLVNRLLKDKNGYKNKDTGVFFDYLLNLKLNIDDKMFRVLYPAVCTSIYRLRNDKSQIN